jgi:phosphonoacetaldehyde hydrolase
MKTVAVIFDWAGTMVDFGSRAPVVAMRQAFAAVNVSLSEAEIRAGMGLAKRDHVCAILSAPKAAAAWAAVHGRPAHDADVDAIFASLEPLMREAGAAHADLIPGAAVTATALAARGLKIGSTTGYTRAMMGPILAAAARQGYAPEVVICAGETPLGRPSPMMIWKALTAMGAWPSAATVKVDDAPAGIAEGKNAGCFTIGIAASGNAMGLDYEAYSNLTEQARLTSLTAARVELLAAGADMVIDTVAELESALASRGLI